jgi:hypothetical protein
MAGGGWYADGLVREVLDGLWQGTCIGGGR